MYLIPTNTENINVFINVGDYVGFNVDTDALYFGTLPPGNSANRNINIYHDMNFPKKVIITPYGEVSEWLTFSENNFWLQPEEYKQVNIKIAVPKNMELGNYTGNISINFKYI